MTTVILLIASNIFMTFAWYGHLKFKETPLFKVIIISWLIAFIVFAVFSGLYLGEGLRWNHMIGFLFIIGAGYFVVYI